MAILTLKDAAPVLSVKNARAVRRLIRQDPTLPFAKKGKRWLVVDTDLEKWVRGGYSDRATKLLEDQCTDGEGSGTSASEALDALLKQPTGKGQKPLNTSSTRRRGTAATA